jgi:hypothetical protein
MKRSWTPERYRRLLRWYPRTWRIRNENAVVGLLVEQSNDNGGRRPTWAERRSLMVNGLGERFLTPETTTRPAIIVYAAAVVYSAWYLSWITWAPGIHYPGTLWPFSNATPIPVAFLLVAFAAALARRIRLARPLAYAAALGELIIWALGAAQGWLGPSLIAALIFSALAVCAGGAPSVRQLVRFGAATILVLVAVYFAPQTLDRIVELFTPGIYDGLAFPMLLAYVFLPLVVLVVGTAVLVGGAFVSVRSAVRRPPM